MSALRSSCSAEYDAEAAAAREAASIDPETLRPRAQPATPLSERVANVVRRIVALFVTPRFVERVTVKDGVVCVSRHLADRLVDQRRIRTLGLSILRHVDVAGQCARLELVGTDRKVEIARHATVRERDLLIESLTAALHDEGATADVRTIVDRSLRVTLDRPSRAPALRRLWLIALAAATLQAVLSLRPSPRAADASPAPLHAPSFRLTSSTGAPMDETTLKGRPYAAFFGFTQCPQVCPTTLLELTRAVDALGPDAAKIDILFVSLDPERDTPRILSDFVAPFDGRVVALTGAEQEIARAAQAFRVYYRKAELEGGGYTIDHTTLVYLVDARGRLKESISFMDHPEMAARRLRDFVREEAAAASRAVRPTPSKADRAVNSTRDNMPQNVARRFA